MQRGVISRDDFDEYRKVQRFFWRRAKRVCMYLFSIEINVIYVIYVISYIQCIQYKSLKRGKRSTILIMFALNNAYLII